MRKENKKGSKEKIIKRKPDLKLTLRLKLSGTKST